MDLLTYKKAVADAPKPTTAQVDSAVSKYLAAHPMEYDDTEIRQMIAKLDANYELIETISVTSGTTQIERTQAPDGTPYAFRAVRIAFENVLPVDTAANRVLQAFVYSGTGTTTIGRMYYDGWKTSAFTDFYAMRVNGCWMQYKISDAAENSMNARPDYGPYSARLVGGYTVGKLNITANAASGGMAGGKIKIYGVRA